MARKVLDDGISGIGNTKSLSCVALSRLLRYAAREATAQNRFTTARLIQAAIASLVAQPPVESGPQRSSPPLGHC
jgi:hypothetical protein